MNPNAATPARERVPGESGTPGGTSASTSVYATGVFWERLWRTSGLQFAGLFILAYVIYGYQPGVGTSGDAVATFYDGGRTRILIAAVCSGLAVLNLLWFTAALRAELVVVGREGWGAAATASSAALGGLLLLLVTVGATLAYSVAGSGNPVLASGLNEFAWVLVVVTSFPRAMLIMASAFGFWRGGLISNALFAAGVAVVVLVLLGGTTWARGGVWAPDGFFSRIVSPGVGLLWAVVVSRVLLARPATQDAW
jgi:hypothetical protein